MQADTNRVVYVVDDDPAMRHSLAWLIGSLGVPVESFASGEEFFRAVAVHAGLTMHIDLIRGRNAHHIVEATFKAFTRALDAATAIDPRVQGVPSTKGVL